MSWLKDRPGSVFEDALALAPHALEADQAMLRAVKDGLDDRRYALISLAIAGLTGCERFADALRGPLDLDTAGKVTEDWRSVTLTPAEQAILAYAEKGTIDEASIRQTDIQTLRSHDLNDKEILSIAAAVSYQNYALRVAAALGVDPR